MLGLHDFPKGAGTSEDSWYDQSTKPKLRLPLAEWIKRRQPEASQTENQQRAVLYVQRILLFARASSVRGGASGGRFVQSRHTNKSAMRFLSFCFVLTSPLSASPVLLFSHFFKKKKTKKNLKEKPVLLPQDYSYSRTRKILEREIKTKKKMTKKRAWKGLPGTENGGRRSVMSDLRKAVFCGSSTD